MGVCRDQRHAEPWEPIGCGSLRETLEGGYSQIGCRYSRCWRSTVAPSNGSVPPTSARSLKCVASGGRAFSKALAVALGIDHGAGLVVRFTHFHAARSVFRGSYFACFRTIHVDVRQFSLRLIPFSAISYVTAADRQAIIWSSASRRQGLSRASTRTFRRRLPPIRPFVVRFDLRRTSFTRAFTYRRRPN